MLFSYDTKGTSWRWSVTMWQWVVERVSPTHRRLKKLMIENDKFLEEQKREKSRQALMKLDEWNKKVYRDDNGEFVTGDSITPKELWENYQIKSGPLFREACWSHIPVKWTEPVREMLNKYKQEGLSNKIHISQIKEKFCYLVVYYSTSDDLSGDAGNRMRELIKECQDKLKAAGLHPGDSNE